MDTIAGREERPPPTLTTGSLRLPLIAGVTPAKSKHCTILVGASSPFGSVNLRMLQTPQSMTTWLNGCDRTLSSAKK